MAFSTFFRFLLKKYHPPSILPIIQVSSEQDSECPQKFDKINLPSKQALVRDSYVVMIVQPKEKCPKGLATFLNV